MEKIKYYSKEIIIIVLLIVILISVNECTNNRKNAISAIKNMGDNTKYFKNKLGTETATKLVYQISNSNLKKEILNKDLELKKLANEFSRIKSIVKYKTKLEIKSIPIHFKDSVPCVFSRTGRYENVDLNFNWDLNQNYFELKNIEIQNDVTILTGFKRKWILGRTILTTDIVNSNKMIKTNEVKTIEVVIPKKIHETRLFNFSLGFASGYMLSKK